MSRSSVLFGALAALLLVLALPSAASAAAVTVRSDGVLTFTSSSTTERNVAAVEVRDGGEVVVSDSVTLTPVTASPCTVTDGGDGDDYVQGDGGADVLRGGAGNDRIRPGAESDVISAGAGNDVVYAIGGGRDVVDCGAGRDRVEADRDDRVRGCESVRR